MLVFTHGSFSLLSYNKPEPPAQDSITYNELDSLKSIVSQGNEPQACSWAITKGHFPIGGFLLQNESRFVSSDEKNQQWFLSNNSDFAK